MADQLGTGSRDIIQGTANDDDIKSLAGDDLVYGLGGNDLINGGEDNDVIYGEAVFYNDKYYLLSNLLFWQEAQNEAISLGGNLVTINDEAENQFLTNIFGNQEALWIGLTDQNQEGTFEWINGEAVTYTNWFPGEPNNFGGNENYAGINFGNSGQWNDVINELGIRGIIEISSDVLNAGDDTLNGLGGNDLINGGAGNDDLYGEAAFYQGKYYILSHALSWQEAQNQALSFGGNLVTINDGAENQFLTNIFGNQEALWIGFTDQNQEGQFEWISGEAVTYTNWFPGEPNNFGGNENYAGINFGNPGQWNDVVNELGIRGIIEISSSAILAGDDTLRGEEGDDRLFGGFGNDVLDGGTGSDTADYSTLTQAITLLPTGVINKGSGGTDQLIQVETIIGAVGQNNVINASSSTGSVSITVDLANLANQNVTVNGLPFSLSFSVKNFVNVIGTVQNDIIGGDAANNQLSGNDGNDTFIGSQGNDTINGGDGIDDTLDYSNIGQAITLERAGFVNKGSAGRDTISNNERIIGAVGQANTIDASNGRSTTTSLVADLANDSLIVNGLPGPVSSLTFRVENFVNVTGTTQADTIIGNDLANVINGNSGDDVLEGGLDNDTFVLALGNGNDLIQDFEDTFDQFGLAEGLTFDQLTILDTGTNTLIQSGSETLATVLNINSSLITSADFITV